MKPLIIGVDPGSTSAVSAIDFEGNKVFTTSRKNFPPSEIISEIVDNGRPVVIASDKAKFPSTVDKIARSLGAYRYTIENDMSSDRKQELGEGENSHEIDASAAARNAFKGLRDRIDTIEELSNEKELEKDKIAIRYFKDKLSALDSDQDKDEASEELSHDNQEEKVERSNSRGGENIGILKRENEILETKVDNLESQVADLKQQLNDEKESKEKWRSKYDRMRTETRKELMEERLLSKKKAEIKEKNKEVEKLNDKLKKASIREEQYLKALNLLEDGGKVFRLYESGGKDGEVFFTRSKDIEKILKQEGEEVFHVDELEGIELFDRIVLEERPKKDVREVLEDYRDDR